MTVREDFSTKQIAKSILPAVQTPLVVKPLSKPKTSTKVDEPAAFQEQVSPEETA